MMEAEKVNVFIGNKTADRFVENTHMNSVEDVFCTEQVKHSYMENTEKQVVSDSLAKKLDVVGQNELCSENMKPPFIGKKNISKEEDEEIVFSVSEKFDMVDGLNRDKNKPTDSVQGEFCSDDKNKYFCIENKKMDALNKGISSDNTIMTSHKNKTNSVKPGLSADNLTSMDDNLTSEDDNLSSTDDNITSVDDNMTSTDDNLISTDDNLTTRDNILTSMDDNLATSVVGTTKMAVFEKQLYSEKTVPVIGNNPMNSKQNIFSEEKIKSSITDKTNNDQKDDLCCTEKTNDSFPEQNKMDIPKVRSCEMDMHVDLDEKNGPHAKRFKSSFEENTPKDGEKAAVCTNVKMTPSFPEHTKLDLEADVLNTNDKTKTSFECHNQIESAGEMFNPQKMESSTAGNSNEEDEVCTDNTISTSCVNTTKTDAVETGFNPDKSQTTFTENIKIATQKGMFCWKGVSFLGKTKTDVVKRFSSEKIRAAFSGKTSLNALENLSSDKTKPSILGKTYGEKHTSMKEKIKSPFVESSRNNDVIYNDDRFTVLTERDAKINTDEDTLCTDGNSKDSCNEQTEMDTEEEVSCIEKTIHVPQIESVESAFCTEEKINIPEALLKTDSGLKSITCELCFKNFTRKTTLKQHMLIHAGEKPYACGVCTSCFADSSSLRRHMLVHTGEKPYECPVCLKCFRHAGVLAKHKLIHTGERPFECQVCSKTFAYSHHYKTHMLIHTGEKPYHCDVCERSFAQHGALKRHVLLHTGEKPFQCDTCFERFARKESLQRHVLNHTYVKPFICHMCSKCFVHHGALVRHMLLHAGQKTFNCGVCAEGFSRKESLEKHMASHAGKELSIQCAVCLSSFVEQDDLDKHMASHEQDYLDKQMANLEQDDLDKHMANRTGNEQPLHCRVCLSSFVEQEDLDKHMASHTEKQGSLQCQVCLACFVEQDDLDKHRLSHTDNTVKPQ